VHINVEGSMGQAMAEGRMTTAKGGQHENAGQNTTVGEDTPFFRGSELKNKIYIA
jgi:hypothetical protein